MNWGRGIFVLLFLVANGAAAWAQSPYRVEIDLEQQTAYLIQGRRIVLASPISSGRSGHLTETGAFKVIEKEQNHFSSLYGKIVDRNGRTVVADADADMAVPRGGKFIPAPMRYFVRFHGATGMHAGYLPGYPASHAAFACRKGTPPSFSTRLKSARRSMSSDERRGRGSISNTDPNRSARFISPRCVRETGLRDRVIPGISSLAGAATKLTCSRLSDRDSD
jgi:hypothetical protein